MKAKKWKFAEKQWDKKVFKKYWEVANDLLNNGFKRRVVVLQNNKTTYLYVRNGMIHEIRRRPGEERWHVFHVSFCPPPNGYSIVYIKKEK